MSELISDSFEQAKGHGADWTRWLAPFIGQPNVIGLELGCWKGESALWFMEHVTTHETSSLITIDTFEGSAEHKLAGIDCTRNEAEARARLAPFGQRAQICTGPTAFWLKELPRPTRRGAHAEQVDFVYVDADHSAQSVLRDAVMSFELLKVGGVLIFDDYRWEIMEQEIDRPKMAIDAFIAAYGRSCEVIGKGWQVAVRRTA